MADEKHQVPFLEKLILFPLKLKYSKNPHLGTYFFAVWQNGFLYFGVFIYYLG